MCKLCVFLCGIVCLECAADVNGWTEKGNPAMTEQKKRMKGRNVKEEL